MGVLTHTRAHVMPVGAPTYCGSQVSPVGHEASVVQRPMHTRSVRSQSWLTQSPLRARGARLSVLQCRRSLAAMLRRVSVTARGDARAPLAPRGERARSRALALVGALLLGCAGTAAPSAGAEEGASPSCRTDQDCETAFSDQCPGGSVAYARCEEGRCRFGACSSPIGTPCDGDPATQFDGEECP